MKKYPLASFALSILVTAVFFSAPIALAGPPAEVPGPARGFSVPCEEPEPGVYIVGLESGTFRGPGEALSSLPRVADVAREVAGVHGADVVHVYDRVVNGFALRLPDGRARALLRDPRVRFVEQSCILHPSAVQSSPGWGLDRVDEAFLPMDNAYEYLETGSGVHVYVLDSGIESHSGQFGSRLLAGWSAFGGDGKIDVCGHGSAVASLAAGTTYGVAKSAYLHPLRMANNFCSASTANATAGINWLITNHVKPAVLNISYWFSLSSSGLSTMENAIGSALSNGIIVVVSANNQNGDACNGSPARLAASTQVITAGGTDSADARYFVSSTDASNYGNCVSLWAPGEAVTMLDVRPATPTSLVASGTSFSAGYTSGAAALYLQSNTMATPSQVKTDLVNHGTAFEVDPYHSGQERLLMAKPANSCFTYTCSSTTKVCTFNATCSTMPQNTGIFRWTFGDGTSLNTYSTTVNHTYPASDIYTASLKVDATYAQDDTDTACVNTTGVGLLGCMPSGATD